MSVLLDIQAQLNDANRNVAELEQALAKHPDYPSIAANLDSAVRVQAKLQAQFLEAAARAGVPVCRYRAFDDFDSVSAGAALGSVSDFQRLVSVVFGSLKYGRKERARVDSDLEKETSFGFGYAFAGSVGVVLTIRSDSTMFGDSYLDDTMNTVFELARASDPGAIQSYAATLGVGAINALFRWVDRNATNGMGAEIEWHPGRKTKQAILLQRQHLSGLRKTIETTSIEEEELLHLDGVLDEADVSRRRFRLKRDGLPPISGSFAEGTIDDQHAVKLPRRYSVIVRKTTKRRFATGADKVRYHLLQLTEFKGGGDAGEPKQAASA